MRFFSTMILLFIVLTNVAFTANPAIIWGSGGYAENLAPTGIKFKSGVLLDDNGTGLSTDQNFSALGSVGVGVASPNEKLTVEGVTSLRETTAPSLTANYGKMFVKATDSLPYFLDDSGVEHSMSDALARIGASTYSTFQDLQNTMHSTGIITGNGITDAGAGAVNVGAGTGLIRATNSDTAELLFFDWNAAAGLTLTDGQVNYIYVEYNAGSPQIVADTTKRTDYNTNLLLGVVSRDGTIVHISDADEIRVGNHSSLMNRRMLDTDPFKSVKDDRPLLGETGTRNISVEAATFWEGLTKFSTAAFDSSVASQFQGYFYRDGLGGWTRIAAQTQIDNLQYDDGTGVLATLTATRYGVHWIYLEQDGDVSVVYGQGDYFLADALDALPPSTIPSQLQIHAKLIGRVIIQKSAATFTLIESISDVTDFQSFVPTEHSSLLGLISGDDHTQYALLAGRAGGQTLIGGTAAGDDLTLQSTSNATKGSILFGSSEYDEVNNRLGVGVTSPAYKVDVNGRVDSVSTNISYFDNGQLKVDTSGFSTFDDSSAYVDGTGGTPGVLTIARNTTTPLRGAGDLQATLAASTANPQYEGFSFDITIDSADQAKKLVLYFDYDLSDVECVDDYWQIRVYDVTNAAIIRGTNEGIKCGKGPHYYTFQTAPDSTSYRVSFFYNDNTTLTTAFEAYFDNFKVGPQAITHGCPTTNWEAYTPTTQGFGTVTGENFKWRRLCDEIVITGELTVGTTAASEAQISLPSGLSTAGTDKISANNITAGNWIAETVPTASYDQHVLIQPNVTYMNFGYRTGTTTNEFLPRDGNVLVTAGKFGINARFPIAGWANTGKMSTDLGNRRIHTDLSLGSSHTITTTGSEKIAFNTVIEDTVAAYNVANTRIDIKETDLYDLSSSLYITGLTDQDIVEIFISASDGQQCRTQTRSSSTIETVHASCTKKLLKGAYVEIYVRNQSGARGTINTTAELTRFSVTKRASPQTTFEGELVAARYSTNDAATNAFTSGATTLIQYEDLDYDTHNMCDSAGTCTIPTPGKYEIDCRIRLNSLNVVAADLSAMYIYKNGVAASLYVEEFNGANSVQTSSIHINDTLDLVTGDTIDCRYFQNTGTSGAVSTVGIENIFTIKRIK